jgi:hypothetical protein
MLQRVLALSVLLIAPALAADPAPVVMQLTGQAPHELSAAELAAMPAVTQHVAFATEHGDSQADFTGPLLWNVLKATNILAGSKPSDAVRQTIKVTGSDGYTAVVAMGELSPAFANHPIQLADRMDGKLLTMPRLVVPGDVHGGRSVHDVVRIDIN